MPSVPKETRKARTKSRSSSTPKVVISPRAVTRRPPTSIIERLGKFRPEPCVPVPIAPPTVWVATSPKFESVMPADCSSLLSSVSCEPAPTAAR